jgi:hypothetical protein
MSSSWKFALLVGAAACALGLISAAPTFSADDMTMPRIEPMIVAANPTDDEALMAPVRREAATALAKLQAAAKRR